MVIPSACCMSLGAHCPLEVPLFLLYKRIPSHSLNYLLILWFEQASFACPVTDWNSSFGVNHSLKSPFIFFAAAAKLSLKMIGSILVHFISHRSANPWEMQLNWAESWLSPPLAFLSFGFVWHQMRKRSLAKDTEAKFIFGLCLCILTLSPELWRLI